MTKLLPLTSDPRFCAVVCRMHLHAHECQIRLPEDVLQAIEQGKESLSVRMGETKNVRSGAWTPHRCWQVLQLGQEEYPLFVSPDENHVAYQNIDGVLQVPYPFPTSTCGLQEIGVVERKMQLRPRAGEVPKQPVRVAKESRTMCCRTCTS